jgi:hypothetical protein
VDKQEGLNRLLNSPTRDVCTTFRGDFQFGHNFLDAVPTVRDVFCVVVAADELLSELTNHPLSTNAAVNIRQGSIKHQQSDEAVVASNLFLNRHLLRHGVSLYGLVYSPDERLLIIVIIVIIIIVIVIVNIVIV